MPTCTTAASDSQASFRNTGAGERGYGSTVREVAVVGEGVRLLLRVAGYERPSLESGADANWLMADAEMTAETAGSFRAGRGVSLRTEELIAFRLWPIWRTKSAAQSDSSEALASWMRLFGTTCQAWSCALSGRERISHACKTHSANLKVSSPRFRSKATLWAETVG
jgi:hypothetical protein